MKIEEMVRIMQAMRQNGVTSFVWQDGEKNLTLEAKGSPPAGQDVIIAAPLETKTTADQESGGIIKSPVVGVFYQAPAPDDDPFVQVGDQLAVGDTVCIIEAMKLMNEVTSTFAGRVTEIFVTDGQLVEFDQSIMRVEF